MLAISGDRAHFSVGQECPELGEEQTLISGDWTSESSQQPTFNRPILTPRIFVPTIDSAGLKLVT